MPPTARSGHSSRLSPAFTQIVALQAEVPSVLDALESLRKSRLICQGFEVAFGERVVVGRVRPVVRTGDTKTGQQKRGRFGLHWAAAIGVRCELNSWHIMFGDGILEQWPKQRAAFGTGDAPADHPASRPARAGGEGKTWSWWGLGSGIAFGIRLTERASRPRSVRKRSQTDKSFLVLFFKKEQLESASF